MTERIWIPWQPSWNLRDAIRARRSYLKRVGFVPTMGYLHAGHEALIRRAREECDLVVVSIFVNPTQFGPNEDFERYPRDLAHDRELCERAGAELIFHPEARELYPRGTGTWVEVEGHDGDRLRCFTTGTFSRRNHRLRQAFQYRTAGPRLFRRKGFSAIASNAPHGA